MKKILSLALLLLFLASCRQDQDPRQRAALTDPQLKILADDQPEWQFENLRLYPVVASPDFIENNAVAAKLKTLEEAIDAYGFRITEKKPYGRFEDSGAVNSLTVQNKTQNPVFLMGGDIVQGGRQDRVVGEDQIIALRSLQDISVFCVEKGRWAFRDAANDATSAPVKEDKIYAFSGYYHVASGDIRQTLTGSKSQEEVWEKVGHLTTHHEAESQTGAYTSLENSQAYTAQRDAYLRFFTGKFSVREDIVGVVAVSGNTIIGMDIFGHPALFRRQIPSLLHSYATDAITGEAPKPLGETRIGRQQTRINMAASGNQPLRYRDALVHFYLEASGSE